MFRFFRRGNIPFSGFNFCVQRVFGPVQESPQSIGPDFLKIEKNRPFEK